MLNTKRILAFSCLTALLLAAPLMWAQIDPDPTTIHVCADASSLCGNSGAIIPVNDSLPTLAITVQGQTGITSGYNANVWLVVMIPGTKADKTLNFSATATIGGTKGSAVSAQYKTFQNSSNSRFDGLGFTVGATMDSSVSAPLSFANANGAPSATGFSVYLINIGAWNMTSSLSIQMNGAGLPAGTVIWAFFTGHNDQHSCSGNYTTCAVNSSPWSESVGISAPEPAETSMLGLGLLFVASFRKKLRPV